MGRKRLCYLDLIRLVAVAAVFGCHFTRSLEEYSVSFTWKIFPDFIFRLYMGSFGVSLFFIISGAALMYVYEEKLEPAKYYRKRLLGIYPMFWMAFAIATCVSMLRDGHIAAGVPQWKIIYSILGVDGNALWWGPNYYQLGEWFLSTLVCLYLVFPLLRLGFRKSPFGTAAVCTVLYVLCILFFHTQMPVDCLFPARFPELLFGMIYVKYIRKTGELQLGLSVLALAAVSAVPRTVLPNMLRTTIVGVAAFSVLAWAAQRVSEENAVSRLAAGCAKYSYPFFLTHHYILNWMASRFAGTSMRKAEELVLFAAAFGATCFASYELYRLHGFVMNFFRVSKNIK